MIVSHKHRFIFVRTEKTAGSSLQQALAAICDPGDAIAGSGRFSNQNKLPRWTRKIPGMGPLRRRFPGVLGVHTHATIKQVRDLYGSDVYRSYFKFTIERNPWDRQLSLYCHRKRKSDRTRPIKFQQDMKSPLYRQLHYTRLRNWETYSINDELAVDYVIRYENLTADIQHALDQIGIRDSIELGRKRTEWRENKGAYREFYTPRIRDLVARWYRHEIKTFDYEF